MSSLVPSAAASATSMPMPLTVLLRAKMEGSSDFFPFNDVATLGTSSSGDTLSFRDLLEEGFDGRGNEILLFETGCRLDDDTADCTRACADTALFFASLETFYNCAALASISYWIHDRGIYYVGPEAEANASSIMGDGTLAEFDDGPVLNAFVVCAVDSCDLDGLGVPCDGSVTALSTETSSPREILDAIDVFCPDITAEINPDIFGPGVLISYVLQVSFSCSLYLFLKFFTLYIRYTHRQSQKQKARVGRSNTLARIETMIWGDSSGLSRTSIAIATTLVEFQEAQCWFVFAVQIASILAIVVNSQEGTFWGEIIVNAGVAFHVSQNGILPMFLVQICLHNEGIRNWHTFVGFAIEWLLAVVAASQRIRFDNAFDLFRSQSPIPSCGGNPSPRTYCSATGGFNGTEISFFPHPLLYKMVFLVLDTVAMLVLTIDQLSWTLRKHQRTKHMRIAGLQLGRWPDHWTRAHWRTISRWFWRSLQVAYLVINILYMCSLIKVINGETFAAERWSYGQIIAVTVWGPVIVKLFDLILSGPPKNGMRLNSGPPRLRIDNVINHRQGTEGGDELDERTYGQEKTPRGIPRGPPRGIPRAPAPSAPPTPRPGDSSEGSPEKDANDGQPTLSPEVAQPPPRQMSIRIAEEGRHRVPRKGNDEEG